MSLASLMDLYVAELADLHDAETQALSLLPRLSDLARAPELRQALSRHWDESRLHVERLQLIFTRLGERPTGHRCAGVAGIVQEADERLNGPATDDARDAGIIGMVQRIEHYEIAAYGCARTYARRLSRPDEARLLHETLEEERRADRRLTEMAEAHINDDARSEADLHEFPRPQKLRYIDSDQLDVSRLSDRRTLAVRNDADDDLGTFDGLIVDADDNRPRYVVVDAGGFLGGHRYLLPVGEVRYDQPGRVLRVALPKEVATRYPPYDDDEFQKMDGRTLRGYQSRLLSFFTRRGQRPESEDEFAPPEWLMTGVWISASGDRVAPLSDAARTFVNEFLPNREQPVATAEDRTARAADRHAAGGRRHAVPADADQTRPTGERDAPTPPNGEKLRG